MKKIVNSGGEKDVMSREEQGTVHIEEKWER